MRPAYTNPARRRDLGARNRLRRALRFGMNEHVHQTNPHARSGRAPIATAAACGPSLRPGKGGYVEDGTVTVLFVRQRVVEEGADLVMNEPARLCPAVLEL
jgi:hypothetical protein